jgi:hypothetical protein
MPRRAVLRALPTMMSRRFDPAAAGDLDALLELRVPNARTGRESKFGVRVLDGQCTITRGAAPTAGAYVTMAADDMLRLASGAVRWTDLLGQKRLELGGDPFLALRFPTLFRFRADA